MTHTQQLQQLRTVNTHTRKWRLKIQHRTLWLGVELSGSNTRYSTSTLPAIVPPRIHNLLVCTYSTAAWCHGRIYALDWLLLAVRCLRHFEHDPEHMEMTQMKRQWSSQTQGGVEEFSGKRRYSEDASTTWKYLSVCVYRYVCIYLLSCGVWMPEEGSDFRRVSYAELYKFCFLQVVCASIWVLGLWRCMGTGIPQGDATQNFISIFSQGI